MSATLSRPEAAELFQLTPATKALLRQRMQDRHANRMPDTEGSVWWIVDSAEHPGFKRLGEGWEGKTALSESDYAHLGYDIGIEPLLRSIQVDGLEVGFITRNRYGAAVLNTDLLPMFDIDTQTDEGELWDPRLGGEDGSHYPVTEGELKQALVELTSGRFGREVYPLNPPGCRAFQHLVSSHWPYFFGEGEPSEDGTELSASVFSTTNGYRVVLHQPLVITKENTGAVNGLMRFLYTDDSYRSIAVAQQLWRSRLTKKPWRGEEPKGRPLQFEFSVSGGEVSLETMAPSNPLLQPLWDVLTADNRDLHPQEGY